MKIIFIICLLIGAVYSASVQSSKDAQVLRYDNDVTGYGGYSFGYETSDGISRQETAELKNAGTDEETLAVKGSYSFVADDGQQYVVNYIADENGYQPEGAHIAVAR